MSDSQSIVAFIQARMSSRRFPGKVLAPFRGRPVIDHVVEAVRRGAPDVPIVVATSALSSDDPLAHHLEARSIPFFRGELDDVVARFCACLQEHPTEWVMRICADSPLLGERVVRSVIRAVPVQSGSAALDLITTIAPRTFPRGSNVEVLSASVLRALAGQPLTVDDREHPTRWIYGHADRYRIANVESGDPRLASIGLSVDTVEDLHRLESFDEAALWAAVERSESSRGAAS